MRRVNVETWKRFKEKADEQGMTLSHAVNFLLARGVLEMAPAKRPKAAAK
jgi:antitoxin component of RelBE/YafQ-DinJ toxin-antitoxin module